MAKVNEKWLAGFFDGDGCVQLKVRPQNDININYGVSPCLGLSQSVHSRELIEELKIFLDSKHINYNEYNRKGPSENSSNIIQFTINGWKNCEKFYNLIKGKTLMKHKQLKILFEDIKPIYDQKLHTTKKGFLRIMIWRDFLNDFKSHHSNGKYDYEYFTDLWDLKLSQDKIPNINKYEESSRINSEKEYKSEESRSIMDF